MNEQEIRARREKCSDCGGQQQEIRLIDRADYNQHTEPVYASTEAKHSFWGNCFPVEGKVLAFLCQDCGRIAHYGAVAEPKK
jgi:uncharacterized OB-fold protein